MDLAVRIGYLRDSTLIARKLFDARTVVIAGHGYLETHGEPAHPEDLAGHRCMVYSNLPEPGRWGYTEPGGNRRSVQVGRGMQASNGEFLCDMAAADLGIAMQPTFIAHAAIRSGAVKPILADFDWPVTPG